MEARGVLDDEDSDAVLPLGSTSNSPPATGLMDRLEKRRSCSRSGVSMLLLRDDGWLCPPAAPASTCCSGMVNSSVVPLPTPSL